MDPNPIPGSHEEIRQLLEENIKLTKAILASTEKTRRHIMWSQVGSYLKLLLILVPLVWGFLYIQPYLKQTLSMYQELLGPGTTGAPGQDGSNDIMDLIREFRKQGIVPGTTTPTK